MYVYCVFGKLCVGVVLRSSKGEAFTFPTNNTCLNGLSQLLVLLVSVMVFLAFSHAIDDALSSLWYDYTW